MIVNTELARSTGCADKDKWETPPHIYKPLYNEYGFTLDPCAEDHTAKCERYYTEKDNGLERNWIGNVVFVNPPYSRNNIGLWTRACLIQSRKPNTTVVGLLPVSTSSDWWHNYVLGKAELRFVNKRIRFVGAPFTAPFSSVIVIWGRSGISTFEQTKSA